MAVGHISAHFVAFLQRSRILFLCRKFTVAGTVMATAPTLVSEEDENKIEEDGSKRGNHWTKTSPSLIMRKLRKKRLGKDRVVYFEFLVSRLCSSRL
jgi:hypothetical protein